MPKVWEEIDGKESKIVDKRVDLLFDAVESDVPTRIQIVDRQILGFADWKQHEFNDVLLPHDVVSKTKTFYSHLPHGKRFKSVKDWKANQSQLSKVKAEIKKLEAEAPKNIDQKAAIIISEI